MKRHVLAIAVITLHLTVAVGQTNQNTRSISQAIQTSHRSYVAAMKNSDVRRLVAHFADEGALLPQNSPMQRGHAAISKWFASWLPATTVEEFVVETINLKIVANTAYEIGTYRMTFVGKNGVRITDQGKYVMVWTRAKGRWLILSDMFNSDHPATNSK